MNKTLSCAALLALSISASTLFANRAEAGCGPQDAARVPAVYRDAAFGGELLRVGHEGEDWEWAPPHAQIVGLWRFSFISEGSRGIPDGAVVDSGFTTWHSDGTELMNSGRVPLTGSFCMGVWEQTGRSTFKLNHYALSFDPSGTTLVGVANIRETVTVDRDHDSYSGVFTLDQYATDNKTILAHLQGKVTAARVTVNCKGACIK